MFRRGLITFRKVRHTRSVISVALPNIVNDPFEMELNNKLKDLREHAKNITENIINPREPEGKKYNGLINLDDKLRFVNFDTYGPIGFVKLVDCMPRYIPKSCKHLMCDHAIVQAARVSFDQGIKTPEKDKKLIDFLIRHRHTSPFEMVKFKFHIKCPIFVQRQWIRHRTANINEISGRYSVIK